MSGRKTGAGRKERGLAFTQDEIVTIQTLYQRGTPISRIAKQLGRGRSSIYRLAKVGKLDQMALDMGLDDE